MNVHAQQIIQILVANENRPKALWLENYVKHEVRSFGIGIPNIRSILIQFVAQEKIQELPINQQIEFLNSLMQHAYTEPKLAAILYLQLYWKTKPADKILNTCSKWFDNQWIADWNVCDWLCVRVLTPLLSSEPEIVVNVLKTWTHQPYLWKARASLVPFAECNLIDRHQDTVFDMASVLIQRKERFCKTAVGWVLRSYSRVDPHPVNDFLQQFKQYTTPEVIRNAKKYM